MKLERKLQKYEAKSNWYKGSAKSNLWRSRIPANWKGGKPIQFKLPNMEYTSILQIPSSKDSRLMKEIARIEPRLAKTTGYHIKLVERSGKPLSNLFSKNLSGPKCHRAECAPCANPLTKGPSFCNLKKCSI